jgi:2',3'-cyclic-nucleotide 2'-phosphodiesterase
MKIIFIGDIVGSLGRATVGKVLPNLKKSGNIRLALANGENLAHGRGLTAGKVHEVLGYGVDYFTSGNHVFKRPEFADVISKVPVLRPANWPDETPGKGHTVLDLGKDGQMLLVSLLGQTYIDGPTENPFITIDSILQSYKNEKFNAIIVDFHAETGAEKKAMGFYLDGRVTALLGTHTHVPTCDLQVLPKGTAYVTDVGMVGAKNSVLGVEPEIIIDRFIEGPKSRVFEWVEKGPAVFNSVVLEIDRNGKVSSSKRVDKEIKV